MSIASSFTPVVRLLSIDSPHDVDFLANAINCHKVIQESTGVPQLTTEKLSQYEIAFPKDIEEEKAIGNYILSIDSLIQSTAKKIESLKSLSYILKIEINCNKYLSSIFEVI